MKPEPFTVEENLARAAADRATLRAYSPKPTGPVSLEEAQARALAYNLDHRLQMFNALLQDRQLDLTRLDMLPNLTANAGYVSRNKELVSSSASYLTGDMVPSNFENVSVDRERTFADLTLSWNIIDFGVSYLQAKQQADRVIIAQEQRRRVINNIFQQVQTAYWTALSSERVMPRIRPIIKEARRALAQSRAAGAERSQDPAEALRYQRSLMEMIQQLEAVEEQLAVAKTQLAQLMGLPPDTSYRLAPPTGRQATPRLKLSIDDMERIALVNRPELREEAYNGRVVLNEGRRAILRLVPGVTLLASLNYDSNSYLRFNDWSEVGARLAASVVRVASIPGVAKLGDVQLEIADYRRHAMTMAVIAQVQISARQYAIARNTYERAHEMAQINRNIANLQANTQEAETGSDLDVIREKVNAVLADLRSNRAQADLQSADGNIFATLGIDPLPADVKAATLPELVEAIRQRRQQWREGRIPVPVLPAPQAPAQPAQPIPAMAATIASNAK
ncbi:TolC family protein [Pseudochelatococcus contaminans]|uniref:Outer membrane protein TolC n=1 Tax=Pseudochelatococcus contaminans TaxID=1538103 RepID=A0A7W6EEI8_9HYPH|nr:TolC family protein [Pseudochelatococcus contaminans]MBB3808175.1 outer membrane protein TolC [Pseudochelatococcus contaminans]